MTLSGKEFEAYGEDVEHLCIDLFYFFRPFPCRGEDYGEIQQKLDLHEVVFVRHLESRWQSLLPAVEMVKGSVSSFAIILQEIASNRQEDKEMRDTKDNDLFDISRDSCSDVFLLSL